MGDASATASEPRRGRNPTEVESARVPGGDREDPEGANVRRAVSSAAGETVVGSGTLSVGSKAPRSIQAWEGSRSAQADEELPPSKGSQRVRARGPDNMGLSHGRRWKPWEADNDEGARAGKPAPIGGWSSLVDETLEVPVGWNKPTSQRQPKPVERL